MEAVQFLQETRSRGEFERTPLISLRAKYVFFPVSKAANSSLKSLLFRCELATSRIPAPKDQRVHRAVCSPLLMPYQLPEELLSNILCDSSFTKFAIVRNPYDRALSCFLDRIQKPHTRPYKKIARALGTSDISFVDFLRVISNQRWADMDVHYRPQAVEIARKYIDYDYIGHFESLEEDARTVIDLIYPNMTDETLGFQSPAITEARREREEFFGLEETKLAREIYGDDFYSFGYEI